jgi:hypothetical protein
MLPKSKKVFDKLGTQIYELPDMSQVLVCSNGPEGYRASLRNQTLVSKRPGFAYIESSRTIKELNFGTYSKMRKFAEAIIADSREP